MAAAEMPWAAASFLKSASQRSKLPVLRQFAFWAKAGAGAPARRPAMRPAIAAPAKPLHTRTLYRIGLSAVVDDIITVERRHCHFGRARLPALLADLAATRLS